MQTFSSASERHLMPQVALAPQAKPRNFVHMTCLQRYRLLSQGYDTRHGRAGKKHGQQRALSVLGPSAVIEMANPTHRPDLFAFMSLYA